MDRTTAENLPRGTLVRHVACSKAFVTDRFCDGRIYALCSTEVSNRSEWYLRDGRTLRDMPRMRELEVGNIVVHRGNDMQYVIVQTADTSAIGVAVETIDVGDDEALGGWEVVTA